MAHQTKELDLAMLETARREDLDLSALDGAYKKLKSGGMSQSDMAYLLELIEAYEAKEQISGLDRWFVPGSIAGIENLPKHAAFFAAGANYPERIFMAGNRCGKTVAGAFEAACHLTGLYPDWWEGRRFERPTNVWACGQTGQTTRDTVQTELMGRLGMPGTGMVPGDLIIKTTMRPGVPNGIDVVQVRHVSGGISVLGFKSFDQDIKAFMGTQMDVVWWDEECPELVYTEMSPRLMTRRGIMYGTFTPLHGLTPLIINYSRTCDFLLDAKRPISQTEEEKKAQKERKVFRAMVQAGWDDVSWIPEEEKQRLYATTPAHMIEARSKGYPSIGSGNVYPFPQEHIEIDPFLIPPYFRRMFALDVGWNKTAALLCAIDPDSDTIYITHEHYVGETEPSIHALAVKGWGDWIPGVIDPAARGRSQIDGNRLLTIYKADIGLNIRPAKNEVDSGIAWVYERLSLGKLKVFTNCRNFFSEYLLYRRDLNGKIIKEDDHLMDCLRYIVNNLNVAIPKPVTNNNGGGSYGEIQYVL